MVQMNYDIKEAISILSRTPTVVRDLLLGLDEPWLNFRKREGAYTPSEVIGHLITNEQSNWLTRMQVILSDNGNKTLPPLDREGIDKNLSLEERLNLFSTLRASSIQKLKEEFHPTDHTKKGIHPSLREVTLEQLLATWVVHDLTHMFQITEILALRYKETVGPWKEFLKILRIE